MKGQQNAKFHSLIIDVSLVKPDVELVAAASLLNCAMFCLLELGCTTINFCLIVGPVTSNNICQLSRRKGACMEEEEVYGKSGCRLFQQKVGEVHFRSIVRDDPSWVATTISRINMFNICP